MNDASFTPVDTTSQPDEEPVTDDITDVLPDDIPVAELPKKHLIKLLHYRTDRSQTEIADLVGTQQSYVASVVGDLPATQQPEIVGTLHECREHDLVRYVKCVEDGTVFDLAPTNGKKKVDPQDTADPRNHINWFRHNRFEGYVVKPEGEEPPERPDGAVKEKRIIGE